MDRELSNLYLAVNAYFTKHVKRKEDADDLTQEVWLKALKNSESLKMVKETQSWFFTIARNTLIDFYRKKKENVNFDSNFLTSNSISESDERLKEQLQTCLSDYIKSLKGDVKQLILEADIKGVSQKELANQLNIPYPTLRSKLQRGRTKIKKMYERDCHLEIGKRGEVLDCRCKN